MFSWLEEATLATALRHSVWAYPLVNAAHIVGVALLIGGAVPLGLRVLGMWRSQALQPLRRATAATGGVGFVLAVFTGSLLFITRASVYAESSFFLIKMAVLLGAIGISIWFLLLTSEGRVSTWAEGKPPLPIRLVAGAVILVWLVVLVFGRLIGYF